MRRIKINKRGVTPIIAVILLMMMTVAAAGAAFFWIVRVQATLTGGTEQHIDTVLTNIGSSAEFRDVGVTADGVNLTFNLRNTGSVPFVLDYNTSILTLKEVDGTIICTNSWDEDTNITVVTAPANGSTIEVNSLHEIKLALTDAKDCVLSDAVLGAGETVQYSNYFGGDVVVGGSFEK